MTCTNCNGRGYVKVDGRESVCLECATAAVRNFIERGEIKRRPNALTRTVGVKGKQPVIGGLRGFRKALNARRSR